jgi:hypothetical protein
MSDRDRKKKDGRNKDKKNRAMRDAVQTRERPSRRRGRSGDRPSVQKAKPGAASDRTRQLALSGEPPGRQTTRPR